MAERIIQNSAFNDNVERGRMRVYTKSLSTLKVENMEVDSQLKTCIKVPTKDLFRGNIFEFPIIDVIIHNDFVEIRGLIVGKLYSGLVLNLEYITGNSLYLLEDFTVESGDILSEYICTTYKFAFKRDVDEEKFNEWYFKLQRRTSEVNNFIDDIVLSDEFFEVNKKLEDFIEAVYKIIFRRNLRVGAFDYWKNKYVEGILKYSDTEVRKQIIDQMLYYRQFEYLTDED